MSDALANQADELARKILEAIEKAAAAKSATGSPRMFSNEYPWAKPSRPGFVPVPADQKAEWETLAARFDRPAKRQHLIKET